MVFKDPVFFLLLLAVPAGMWWRHREKPSALLFPSFSAITPIAKPLTARLRNPLLSFLYWAAAICFIFALARPQSVTSEREYESEGIDIVIAMDISGSMQAMDFQPANRLQVAKEEAKKFILGRKQDRIGLVIFARQSYTQCPLTLDYEVLTRFLDEVEMGLIKDGTAIGLAIATSVNRLRDSTAKSKVIILITDGANNAGNIDPLTATELAKTFGIRIYTIGVGKEGLVPFPVDDPLFGRRYVQAEVEMDEPMMQKIAAMTRGVYFRARDERAMAEIYRTIDQMEKSKVKVKEYTTYEELYPYFLIPGMLALFSWVLLDNTVLVKIP